MKSSSKRKIPFYPVLTLIGYAIRNGGVSARGSLVFFGLLLRFIILEPFRLIELLLFDRRINKHQIKEDPIFVLGHWRSGTSHLQYLLNLDSKNTTTTLYRFLFADTYYLTESWLKKVLNIIAKAFHIPYSFQRIQLNFNLPGELDPSLCSIGSQYGYTWGHLFPKRFERLTSWLLSIENDTVAQNWLEDYDYLIRKLSYREKNKRVVVKSPGDTARIKLLLSKYPKAKFVYIHRHPIDVFHSTRNLWDVILKENSFQKIKEDEITLNIINTYKLLLGSYLTGRNEVPANQLVEVCFDDLQNRPIELLGLIYNKLELGQFPVENARTYLKQNKSYKINHYQTSLKLEAQLRKDWKFSFDHMPSDSFMIPKPPE